MRLIDILTSPWAIVPDNLREIQAIYATHLRGEKIDIAGVEARLGRPLANEPKPYQIIDGVAVLPIEGVLAKRANMFMQISGGASTELIGRDLRAALADPNVHSVILAIDSPGGEVDGVQTLANAVLQSRSAKPIVAWASGAMASGAYWIGSAASKVYIADGTTRVGSIGVVMTHTDVSGAEAKEGVKTTEVYAGKYKRIASQYAALSDAGRESMQEKVDYLYSLFVGAVAQQRGKTEDQVLADMADGRVFIGEQAVKAGLVDGVSTLDALIADLNKQRSAGAAQQKPTSTSGAIIMPQTREQILAESPDVAAALIAEGAAAERARIQAVENALIPGHEALIASLKFDGKTSGGDAALAVNAAERKTREAAARKLADDAPNPAPNASTPAVDPKELKPQDDLSKPVAERCKAKWEANADGVRSEFTSLEAFTAYTKAHEAGNVRILGARKAS